MISVIVATLLAGLAWCRWVGRFPGLLVWGPAMLVTAIFVLPLDRWLAEPLENTYLATQLPALVDGIVILGGPIERLVVGAQLARRYPGSKIIIAGILFSKDGAQTLISLGVKQEDIVVEPSSTNTWEDLVLAERLAKPKSGQTWLLVTSAVHLPRAMGVAKHLGWTMTPVATKTVSQPAVLNFAFVAKASKIDEAAHEYLGLLAYRVEGRIDTLFPTRAENRRAN